MLEINALLTVFCHFYPINKCYVLEKSKWHTYIVFNNAMIDHGCTGNQTHNGRSGFPRPFCFLPVCLLAVRESDVPLYAV